MKYLLIILLFPVIASAQQKIRISAIGTNSISTDTTHLSTRIDQRVKYTDTASMLYPTYLRAIDTTGKWAPAGSVGSSATPETAVGQIYNQSSFSSLTGLLDSGGVNPTFSGGEMIFTTGAGTYLKTISLNTGNYAFTCLPQWKIALKIKRTSTSNGVFVGIRSTNTWSTYQIDCYGKINLDGTGANGQLQIVAGGSHSTLATSASNLSLSTNDLIVLTMERDWNTVTFTARNQTTNSGIVSVTYTFDMAGSSNPLIMNTGRFSFGSLSVNANLRIDSFAISSITNKHAQMMVVGDSKSSGYCASAWTASWNYQLDQYFRSFVTEAGPSDRLMEALSRINELVDLDPENVLLNIGRNDMGFGADSNTIKTNYATLVTVLTNAGITVWHLLPFYETFDQTWFANYIIRTYPSDHIIDTWNATHFTGLLNIDNVHPNDTGHGIIYKTILNTFYFQTIIPHGHYR